MDGVMGIPYSPFSTSINGHVLPQWSKKGPYKSPPPFQPSVTHTPSPYPSDGEDFWIDEDLYIDREEPPVKPDASKSRFKIIRPYVPPSPDLAKKATSAAQKAAKKAEMADALMRAAKLVQQEKKYGKNGNRAIDELDDYLTSKGIFPEDDEEPPVLKSKSPLSAKHVSVKSHGLPMPSNPQIFKFPSSRNPKKLYDTTVYWDGSVDCTCTGYAISRNKGDAHCSHIDKVQAKFPYTTLTPKQK
jgi:hypothetical protein